MQTPLVLVTSNRPRRVFVDVIEHRLDRVPAYHVTVACLGACRTPGGRRRRTSHSVADVLMDGERYREVTCGVCQYVSWQHCATLETFTRSEAHTS